jgi:hypothetical protein
LNTLLVVFGAFFALLYALIALVQTLRRKPSIRWFEIALIFLVVFLPLIALALEALETSGTAADQDSGLLLAIAFGVFGLILLIIEFFRPQRLRQSRGLLSLFSALLLGAASLLIPFLIAYFSFVPESSQPQNPVVANNAAATTTPDDGETFMIVFGSVINVVAEESELSNDEVLTALDGGQTVADIVRANGGDLDTVIDQITTIMQDFIRELMQQNRIDRLRGAAGIATMRLVVEYAVNNDLASLSRSGQEGEETTPEATPGEGTPRESYFSFLTVTVTPAETTEANSMSATSAASVVPTITEPPTSQPSATRTPRPTATATPTRDLFSTRTPSPTPTLPSPCLLLPLYNVNLRQTPSLDAALISTIPYETAINAFGRNEDASWWYVEYEGSAGWIKAEFVSVTASCALLPERRP